MANKRKDYEPFKNKKKAEKQKKHDEEKAQGFAGSTLVEAEADFDLLTCEKAIKGQNNAWIVLGRDRPGGTIPRMSGVFSLGGVGRAATQSGAIDMVVGRHSASPDGIDPELLIGPDMFKDAARIYITQKGDVDKQFELAKGSEILSGKRRSGAAMKADHIRLHARNHIKIVTGRAKCDDASGTGERNSLGGKIQKVGGIDLIAGNYTGPPRNRTLLGWFKEGASKEKENILQPLVKGDNLKDCMKDVIEAMSQIVDMVRWNNGQISKLGLLVAKHGHIVVPPSPPIAIPSAPLAVSTVAFSAKNATQMIAKTSRQQYNFGVLKINYLIKLSPKYINSRHVNTT